jgi:hypothetical protein
MRPKTAPPWRVEDDDGRPVAAIVRHRRVRGGTWRGDHRASGRARWSRQELGHATQLGGLIVVCAALVPVALLAPLPGTSRPAGTPGRAPAPTVIETVPQQAGAPGRLDREPPTGPGGQPGDTNPPGSDRPTPGGQSTTPAAPLEAGSQPPTAVAPPPPTADTPSPSCPPQQPKARPPKAKGPPSPRPGGAA